MATSSNMAARLKGATTSVLLLILLLPLMSLLIPAPRMVVDASFAPPYAPSKTTTTATHASDNSRWSGSGRRRALAEAHSSWRARRRRPLLRPHRRPALSPDDDHEHRGVVVLASGTTGTAAVEEGREQYYHHGEGDSDPLLTPIPTSKYLEVLGGDVELLPRTFAYPHCYDPHPLAKMAADELRARLIGPTRSSPTRRRPRPRRDDDEEGSDILDYSRDIDGEDETTDAVGKMMGVLVVRYDDAHDDDDDENNERRPLLPRLGYLAAYSGTLPSGSTIDPAAIGFCPPVYDRFEDGGGFYSRGEAELNVLNREVERTERDPERARRAERLADARKVRDARWSAAKGDQKVAKEERRRIRERARQGVDDGTIGTDEYDALDERLKQEGAAIQREMKRLKLEIAKEVREAEESVDEIEGRLEGLRDERKRKSRALQDGLFLRYSFLAPNGSRQSLLSLFADTPMGRPPSGAGDCAAPKLLQQAHSRGYAPVAMAEFWWGAPPGNGEVRRHGLYYPACRGKCEPILGHMLGGMDVGGDPNIVAPAGTVRHHDVAGGNELDVIHEDDFMVVVNKPEGMLSAPGRSLEHSVQTIAREMYPDATGPLLVHRLDMSTSGVLLVAKSKEVHKGLSAQFIDRSVGKRYVALLDGELERRDKKGTIDLPLTPDYLNRPMQRVSEEGEGKPARTVYEVVGVSDGLTRVHFYPLSGRTHQLRVHAAHGRGLDCPIRGDDIYGQRDDRLYLHAEELEVTHPITGERMTFAAPAPF